MRTFSFVGLAMQSHSLSLYSILFQVLRIGGFFLLGSPAALFAQYDTVRYVLPDTSQRQDARQLLPDQRDGFLNDPRTQVERSSWLWQMPDSIYKNYRFRLDSAGTKYYIEDAEKNLVGSISVAEYRLWKGYQDEQAFFKRNIASSGKKETDVSTGRTPKIEVELPSALGPLLGGNKIEIQPTGSVLLDFGGKWQRVDNPAIPVRLQRNGGINFDQRIQLGLTGKIGDKINLNSNFDTKAIFQYENMFNQGYNGYEQDIVQNVQFGNVSMQSNNTLITAGQNLFGISTRLRFGKLWINTLFSNQRGRTETLTIRNGAQSKNFEIRADQYEGYRHYFLGHFFRDNYENALRTMPTVTSGVNITRVEIYVTNRNNDTESQRNIVGFLDLGEGKPFRSRWNGNAGAAGNNANELFAQIKDLPKEPTAISDALQSPPLRLENGTDYVFLRSARKLKPNEFSFHPQLGYISLLQPLRTDEILAVAYEYTYNGQVFKVGQLTEDYQNSADGDVVLLKVLNLPTVRTDLPIWDLMMKNIYSLQTTQLQREGFQFRIVYRDDLTGMDNPSLHEGQRTKDIPLVQITGLDRLNPNLDPQPDGNFDYVEGVTINPQLGQIIFPTLEPFGQNLRARFDERSEIQFINKYVFDELYRGTQADAVLFANKSKFFFKGSYQGSSNNEIMLPGINISPNSVSVTVGGARLNEGTDFTVDYQMGRVRILNQGVLSSGKDILIQYERADLFSFQTRNLMGLDAEYHFTKDFKVGATLLHLNERPIITRVTTGTEPIRNTVWGLHSTYQSQSGLLTRLVDKIPGIDTKAPSSISLRGEFAHLIPGENKLIKRQGGEAASYIDDFETSEIPFDLTRQPTLWVLGSTPTRFRANEGNPLAYAYKRAKLTWFNVDFTAFFNRGFGQSPPPNITREDQNNHYTRIISFNEIFQGRDAQQLNNPEGTLNLAYFPSERGQYNYNPDLNRDGTLRNPKDNFGAITKGITTDIDFDKINIQYIEFWLLDPFINSPNGRVETPQGAGAPNTTGGSLYFNLGSVSEDLIPDTRHNFENGLPANENEVLAARLDTTAWGLATRQQFLLNAFSSDEGARERQDVGLDGLNDVQERAFFADYLQTIQSRLDPAAFQRISLDPSNDNFRYYLDERYDQENKKILGRYLNFNNLENNSPANAGTAAYSVFPDNEDLNRDNTINDIEAYYEYKVDLTPGRLEENPYVVDKVTTTHEETGEQVSWYQFRIPIQQFSDKIGGIEGFKSIRFMRLYLTEWEQPVVLRMAQFQLVGAQWRPYFSDLRDPDLDLPIEPYESGFRLSTVSIERNGVASGENIIPYVVPPGFVRDIDPTSITQARLNEQSLQMCVDELRDTDSRAAFKNVTYDLINYGRVKMFLHAQSQTAKDGEMSAFLRLGTDFKDNYYEIEVPLSITPYSARTTQEIWLSENEIDLPINALLDTKNERNKEGLNILVPYSRIFEKYKLTVVGNPDISNVQLIMIGVRNPRSADALPKDICIWANELRVTEFNKRGGWAANATMQAQLADFANVNAALRYSSPFWGSIQDRIAQRQRFSSLYYDVSANVALDKIFLNRLGISLPMYVGFESDVQTPFFNPLDPDIELDKSIETRYAQSQPDFRNMVSERFKRRSLNFTNVRKTKVKEGAKLHFWDIENLTANFAYMESERSSITLAADQIRNTSGGLAYNYGFKAKPWEPFKKNEALNSPFLKLLRDFNLTPLPTNITVAGNLTRHYQKTQYRNSDLTTDGILPMYQKSFMFDRLYNVRWNLSKNLTLDYNATANAIIDEPAGEVNREAADSMWTNFKNFGRMKFYNQTSALNYRLPLDKIPLTDFINADLRYSSNYTWTAGAVGIADSLGHVARNGNQKSINGQIDMTKLYNKSAFLRQVLNPKAKPETIPYKEEKKKRLQFKIKRLEKRKKTLEEKRVAKLEQEKERRQSRNDSTFVEAQLDSSTIEKISRKWWKKQAKTQVRKDTTEARLKALQQKQKMRKENPTLIKSGSRSAMGLLLAVKKINVSYSENSSTLLPGFMLTPKFLGVENSSTSLLPFAFGAQNRSYLQEMVRRDWLSQSVAQTNPLFQDRSRTLNVRIDIEPIPDFQIQIEAQQTQSNNFSEVIRYNQNQYLSETAVRSGNFSMTTIALRTAFSRDDNFGNSPIFDDFIQNRERIRSDLSSQNEAGDYTRNAQDVIIPAFLQAYLGRGSNTTAFFRLPLPNWKVNYNGLHKTERFKEVFKSFTLTHAYSSLYSIGNYTSSLLYDASVLNLDVNDFALPLASQFDAETGELVPIYVMNQVGFTEKFSPLIGINARTQSDITIKLNFNRTRTIGLTLSNVQVTELRSNDILIDIGFRKQKVKIPFSDIVLPNDLTFRCAFTLRDTRTVQRRIDDQERQESKATAGNINIQFRPTLSYTVNQRVSLTAYFDRTINNPVVLNAFPRKTTAFGVQVLFSLAQ